MTTDGAASAEGPRHPYKLEYPCVVCGNSHRIEADSLHLFIRAAEIASWRCFDCGHKAMLEHAEKYRAEQGK